jgi:hypothetical protein
MDEEKVTVEIDEKGFIRATAKGLSGPACIDGVTRLLKDIAVISSIDKTDEFYGQVRVKNETESKLKTKR